MQIFARRIKIVAKNCFFFHLAKNHDDQPIFNVGWIKHIAVPAGKKKPQTKNNEILRGESCKNECFCNGRRGHMTDPGVLRWG